ncbi:hypothetical protein [Psychromonas ossibalaenae]|uniref:hypothetical protein n=1 Tax=Psychromonas ossibalaenae TaxID=444922 RepID=UPI000525D070|nr:hypothetical protein [Psychromonas ossibalaenae]
MDAHKDKALRGKYSLALMSNHKWRKLFLVMAEYGSDFSGIEYHFTDTDNIFYGHAPSVQQVWESAIDDPVQGAGGPVEYKYIESILIPNVYLYRAYKNAPLTERPLNVKAFIDALEQVGSFPITEMEKGIVIHGYKT